MHLFRSTLFIALLFLAGCLGGRPDTPSAPGDGGAPGLHDGPAAILAGWGSYATWGGGALVCIAVLAFAFGAKRIAVGAGTAAAGLIAAGIILSTLGAYYLWFVLGVVLFAGFVLWRSADRIEDAIKRTFGVKVDLNFNGR